MHAVGRGVRLNWASGEGEGRMATARGFCRQDLTLPNLTSTPAVWLWGTTHQVRLSLPMLVLPAQMGHLPALLH